MITSFDYYTFKKVDDLLWKVTHPQLLNSPHDSLSFDILGVNRFKERLETYCPNIAIEVEPKLYHHSTFTDAHLYHVFVRLNSIEDEMIFIMTNIPLLFKERV